MAVKVLSEKFLQIGNQLSPTLFVLFVASDADLGDASSAVNDGSTQVRCSWTLASLKNGMGSKDLCHFRKKPLVTFLIKLGFLFLSKNKIFKFLLYWFLIFKIFKLWFLIFQNFVTLIFVFQSFVILIFVFQSFEIFIFVFHNFINFDFCFSKFYTFLIFIFQNFEISFKN